MWILYIIGIIFLILLGIAKLILNMIFRKRCEGNSKLKYFTSNDFEELNANVIEFKSNKGQTLRGNIYTNDNIKEYKGLIIFVHGMGAGHLSYTTEINTFTKVGFMVMAYDNTGTCSSEGENLNGFFQSVIDLNYALNFVKANEDLNKYPIFLVGHSWGAYTVCQVLQFNHNIKAVVSISGVNDSDKLICDLMKNETKINFNFLKPFLKLINLFTFGKKACKSTVEILKNTDVPVLLLHGEDDKTVTIENSLVYNKETLSNKNNIKMIIYKDKLHNVYQTKESETYLNSVFGDIAQLNKKYKGKELEDKCDLIYKNIDYKKITEEDKEVMTTIINFIMDIKNSK